VLLISAILVDVFQERLGNQEGSLEKKLELFPVAVDALEAEVAVEGVGVCASDYACTTVRAALFVIKKILLDECALRLRELKGEISSSRTTHGPCSHHHKVIVFWVSLHWHM
jgi:hypothetical protein